MGQVLLWWPPKHAEQAQQAETPQPIDSKKAREETFSPETAKLLAHLGSKQPAGPSLGTAASSSIQAG